MVQVMMSGDTQKRNWIFTFGCGQKYAGHYVKIYGTFDEARQKMFDRFGDKWCWQYTEEEFFSDVHGTETELQENLNEF